MVPGCDGTPFTLAFDHRARRLLMFGIASHPSTEKQVRPEMGNQFVWERFEAEPAAGAATARTRREQCA